MKDEYGEIPACPHGCSGVMRTFRFGYVACLICGLIEFLKGKS